MEAKRDMEGSLIAGGMLTTRLVERIADLEGRVAAERGRSAPDLATIRRMSREIVLTRDRMAALRGCAMPAWTREG